jgi:hypothetical protein
MSANLTIVFLIAVVFVSLLSNIALARIAWRANAEASEYRVKYNAERFRGGDLVDQLTVEAKMRGMIHDRYK